MEGVEETPFHCVKGAYHILTPSTNEPILYHGDDVRPPTGENVPDDFYDVTAADVGVMWKELQSTRLNLENAPLTSAAAREAARNAEVEKTLKAHPQTMVRIRFPNRYVLQGTFRTVDRIGVVANFVRKFLKNPSNIYLFTTPPKQILNLESRLIELNLVGSAVIYVGCEEEGGLDLDESFLTLLSDPSVIAEKLREKHQGERAKLDRGSFTTLPPRPENQLQDAPTTSAPPPPRTESNAQRVPKWFKTAK